jgi:hypothetical protein
MTRIHPLLKLLLQRLRYPGRAAHRRFLMMNLAELDPLPLGPGWFDSSWELENGLEICESTELGVEFQAWPQRASREPVRLREPAIAPRAANLIEFEFVDVQAPLRPARVAPPAAELELALV